VSPAPLVYDLDTEQDVFGPLQESFTMTRCHCWFLAASVAAYLLSCSQVRADLHDYVRRPDPAYSWKVERTQKSPAGTSYQIRLTSQVWHGITWKHQLVVYEPASPAYFDTMLLFITGGTSTSQLNAEDAAQGFALANLSGASCAVLHQVPNQPLLDGKTEDDLIAETFMRYLDTKDETWPLLFPMTKSAVRAMDALQAWAQQEGKQEVAKFVVSGASKRGWTTWLTGAVDKRVVAIAPMVIVTLNMRAQNPHQLEAWGKFSEQIEDYTKRGLTERLETPDGLKLWKMIDPYTYRDSLTMPKLLINGTNDRYWTLDALNLYWDDLKGPKYVVYLPNAGHGLEQHRDYATHGLGALFRSAASGKPLPKLSWKHSQTEAGTLRLSATALPAPDSGHLWVAHSDTMDFRESVWSALPMFSDGTTFTGDSRLPEKGFMATFGDFQYTAENSMPYHLSTQIQIAGPKARK
jgi:PhoPQ-activated pathogenicity-related protein